ncbi:hypothetical protein JW823_06660 [bacterium]|nr:hypothetical protein [candidate division CSSED10-310 bacterium]
MKLSIGIFAVISVIISLAFCQEILAQDIPSTVSVAQWRDSFLAKWQSAVDKDKLDAIVQLSSLLLVMSDSDPLRSPLIDRLEVHVDESADVQMAIAFSLLSDNQPEEASKRLLDLILRYPNEPRIQRFRIALARSFRAEGQLSMATAQLDPLFDFATDTGRYAILEKAMILKDMQETQKALDLLNQLDSAGVESLYFSSLVRAEKESLEMKMILSGGVEIE